MATRRGDARSLAWQVLNAVETGAFADAELARRLASFTGDDKERRLATALVYGTLTWQGLCDHVLRALGRDPARLDPPLRALLQLALFQIIKLDRIPAFAAVDTAVELAKSHRKGSGAKLVNALLRRFLREGADLHLPPRRDLARHLAVAHSHPEWLVRQWLTELGGIETEALLAANNRPAPTVLRVRAGAERDAVVAALRAAGVEAAATPYSPAGIAIAGGADAARLPPVVAGLASLQGEVSQLVALLLGVEPSAAVLDACAAPGGKSTAIAERLQGTGHLLAFDRNLAGLRRLRAECERLGVSARVAAVCADAAAAPLAAGRDFDAVLLDAPCSGLGTLRQHPEIRWRRRKRDLRTLARRQRALLGALAERIRPGGCLVYATCTLAREENQRVVESFLADRREFQLDDARAHLPAGARSLVNEQGYLLTMPQHGNLDGFFAARLKRIGELPMVRS